MGDYSKSIDDLRKEFLDFMKETTKELKDIWIKITKLETKQLIITSFLSFSMGLVGAIIVAIVKTYMSK